jgi:hypothetical protein
MIAVKTPCCNAGIVEAYLVTALCGKCFKVVNIEACIIHAARQRMRRPQPKTKGAG